MPLMPTFVYRFVPLLVLAVCLTGNAQTLPEGYTSETLRIEKISDHVYQHISYFNSEEFGRVECNGMVVFDGGEALIFDTPTDNPASGELIDWIEDSLHCQVKAILPTHFHADCLAGLDTFHKHRVPSYAGKRTIELAKERQQPLPQHEFDSLLELTVGRKKVIAQYFGEGHTRDNIIGYVPDEQLMFGGCLIKELKAGKGNLEDANVEAWPQTVRSLKETYPNVKTVVPGHGQRGGADLLDYTIDMFEQR